MAITTLLDPALLPARTMDQDTFNAAMAYLMTNLPTWGAQTNAIQSNLNSIAAGGAYALPYTFSSSASEVDPGSGKLGLSSTPQSSSIALRVNLTSSAGVDMTSLLNDFGASTSGVTGSVRLQKVGDVTKWLQFNVTSVVDYTGYKRLNVTFRGGSAASPFTAGDALMLFFQRTGDKGDTGTTGTYPLLHAREEQPAGSAGAAGVSVATNYYRRALNTVKTNTISGAALSGNQITGLPAGTYDIRVRAPLVGLHRVSVYDVTGTADLVLGGVGAEVISAAQTMTTSWSEGAGRVTIAAGKTIEVRTFNSNGQNGWGSAVSDSRAQAYTEIWIEKVS
jgi:hypothetical protein